MHYRSTSNKPCSIKAGKIVRFLLYLMVPTMSATYPVAPAPTWVTHPETNRAQRCLTSQRCPDTLRIAVKASSYSKAVYVSYIPSGTPCHYILNSCHFLISPIQYQRTNGPVNAHLISWPSKAQNIRNLENIW